MKILLRVIGAIVACAILAGVVLSIRGVDPNQRRPGLWLKGDVENFPADWAFANKYPTLMVETHPWYLIPHSVTIFFVTYQGDMYLHADYPPGGKFPADKTWTSYVSRNPKVQIKLGNQVFDGKTVLVTDPAMYDALFETFRQKYPKSPYSDYRRRSDVYFLHFVPG
jgi:hypothetical protein